MNSTEGESQPPVVPVRSFARLLVIGIAMALVIAAMWIVIALLNPTVTYHLSPLILASAPSVVARLLAERALPWRHVLITAAAGGVVAGIATVILVLADALQGPVITAEFTAIPGSALAETVVVLAMGVVLGAVIAAIGKRN